MTIEEALRIAGERTVDVRKLMEFIDLVMKKIKVVGFVKLIKTQKKLGSY